MFLRLALAFTALLFACLPVRADGSITVFAPSSMGEVIAGLSRKFTQETGTKVVLSVAGSGQLARQVANGAPADVFITADGRWMDWSEARDAIKPESRAVFASNLLVVAVRNEVENWADVESLLTANRFAMGEPESVPAGTYARQALQSRGWWEAARKRAVFGENVRIALARVARGEVGAAIVYGSDAAAEPTVKPAFTFAPGDHETVAYWVAATRRAGERAQAYIDFLQGADAQALLAGAGFTPPQKPQ